MDLAGLPALLEAIRHMHGCEATWLESVHVTEMFEGNIVWDGEVQVFLIWGREDATRVYAWSSAAEGSRRRFVAVLGVGPIHDAVAAVRASIVADNKK